MGKFSVTPEHKVVRIQVYINVFCKMWMRPYEKCVQTGILKKEKCRIIQIHTDLKWNLDFGKQNNFILFSNFRILFSKIIDFYAFYITCRGFWNILNYMKNIIKKNQNEYDQTKNMFCTLDNFP